MKSYAERTCFTEDHLTKWRKASSFVERLPTRWVNLVGDRWIPFDAVADKTLKTPELRCHELARAIGRVLKLKHVDGKYGNVEHTWLELREWGILDVYCPGRVPQVQLVDAPWMLPESKVYIPGPVRDDIREALVDVLAERFREHLAMGAAMVAQLS